MKSIQRKIVEEIVEDKRKNPDVVAINIFGSVALGLERPNSDVDIEIISSKAKRWSLVQQKKYGIKIDLETSPKYRLVKRVKTHPFLCYSYLFEEVVYDTKEFMKKIISKLKKYFKEHPEVKEFWEKERKAMREAKKKGKKPEDPFNIWDEAEIKFSKEHKVTRDFFKKK